MKLIDFQTIILNLQSLCGYYLFCRHSASFLSQRKVMFLKKNMTAV